MKEEPKLLVSERELRNLIREARQPSFGLVNFFNEDNIVEIAKSQFPRLEAKVAMHLELERTKRLLIIVAAICVLAGSVLIVFAPTGKEGVSYAIAAVLAVLSLGAVGIQEFRIRTVGTEIASGRAALEHREKQ